MFLINHLLPTFFLLNVLTRWRRIVKDAVASMLILTLFYIIIIQDIQDIQDTHNIIIRDTHNIIIQDTHNNGK